MGNDDGDWLKKYHAEHASYGGASHEFHARAQTWIATRDAEIAHLKRMCETENASRQILLSERAELQRAAEKHATALTAANARAAKADEEAARLRAALAAGPAALRGMNDPRGAAHVEAAQEAAMKEKP